MNERAMNARFFVMNAPMNARFFVMNARLFVMNARFKYYERAYEHARVHKGTIMNTRACS